LRIVSKSCAFTGEEVGRIVAGGCRRLAGDFCLACSYEYDFNAKSAYWHSPASKSSREGKRSAMVVVCCLFNALLVLFTAQKSQVYLCYTTQVAVVVISRVKMY
jgi:hypothetical protein